MHPALELPFQKSVLPNLNGSWVIVGCTYSHTHLNSNWIRVQLPCVLSPCPHSNISTLLYNLRWLLVMLNCYQFWYQFCFCPCSDCGWFLRNYIFSTYLADFSAEFWRMWYFSIMHKYYSRNTQICHRRRQSGQTSFEHIYCLALITTDHVQPIRQKYKNELITLRFYSNADNQ